VRRKPRVRIAPIIDGGGHERGMRSGTLNVPAIVGFGAAAEIAQREMAEEGLRTGKLRRRLQDYLFSHLDHLELNGHPELRLPGNLNVSFAYVEGEALMMAIKNVAVSSGSACTSASLEPSYVLRACGVSEDLAHTSIRFGSAASTPRRRWISSASTSSIRVKQAAGHEPPLRDGQGGDRPLEDTSGRPTERPSRIECGLDASKLVLWEGTPWGMVSPICALRQ